MENELNLNGSFPVILTTLYSKTTIIHPHLQTHPHTRTHLYIDMQIGRQLGVKCFAQRHIDMRLEEAGGCCPGTGQLLYLLVWRVALALQSCNVYVYIVENLDPEICQLFQI